MPVFPPDGFELHDRKSPLTDPWEPIYAQHSVDQLILGLELSASHTNSRGFAHGGMIAALADNTMGLNCVRRFEARVGLVTTNLAIDYYGIAKVGQWVSFVPRHIRTGKTLCFADLFVMAEGEPCARANATFKVFM